MRLATGSATLRVAIGGLFASAFLMMAAAAAANLWLGIPVYKLTRDPAALTHSNPFLGAISNMGILIWCAGATVCLFSYVLLRQGAKATDAGRSLLVGGILTTFLMLDDLFTLHEAVFPIKLGIPEKATYVAYAAAFLGYGVRYRAVLASRGAFLLLAGLFMGFSMCADFCIGPGVRGRHLIEDGAKLLGIVSWTAHYLSLAFTEVVATRYLPVDNPRPSP